METKIIAVSQSKGGSGKTTTSINITGALIEKGYKAVLVDLDINKPDATRWAKKSDSIDFVRNIDVHNMFDEILELKNEYDFIIFDCPPNYIEEGMKAIMCSDFIILPASPSFNDQSNLKNIIDTIKIANKPYGVLVSRIKKNTSIGTQVYNDILQNENGFKTYITNRTSMEEAGYAGEWIGTYDKGNDNHKQFLSLADELLNRLNISRA
ncbi:chromosome partitioning protein ParA (plasmid) [Francisella halioticida]|uniref:ParA family protein n=1 Tax=Francisella halioticida TaxID=549298 RepID=UPI001AFC3B49|nr:ParA family protein [Francisella halioticida]BCD92643.1 chromosome partitioning protein ParA [Francisella halioticida]